MKGRLYLLALLFLAAAVLLGIVASGRGLRGSRAGEEAIRAGTGELGTVIADLLWLQLDRYHHIWMYQGNQWATATDYLPQLWLITRLDPDFAEAYIDGGYHLAVNLGHVEDGLELLYSGRRNCPESEGILWEILAVVCETGHGGPRAAHEAAWDYLRLVARKRGHITEPWNEANADLILEFTFQDDSSRVNHERLARIYEGRTTLIRYARSRDLWTPQQP